MAYFILLSVFNSFHCTICLYFRGDNIHEMFHEYFILKLLYK